MAKASKEKKPKARKVNRNSKSGEFVSKQYAKDHPATTQTETIQAWERGEGIKCEKND